MIGLELFQKRPVSQKFYKPCQYTQLSESWNGMNDSTSKNAVPIKPRNFFGFIVLSTIICFVSVSFLCSYKENLYTNLSYARSLVINMD